MKIRGNTVGTTLKPKAALVKCDDLNHEEKAQIRKKFNAAYGSENHVGFNTADGKSSVSIESESTLLDAKGNVTGAVVVLYVDEDNQPIILRNIATCVEDGDVANKGYVDCAIAAAISAIPNLDEVSY